MCVKERKVKPFLCSDCGTTNINDFKYGKKSICETCDKKLRRKIEPRKVKPYLCKICGETDETKFANGSKGKCNKCKKPVNPKKTGRQPITHHCKVCDTTDPNLFYKSRKSICYECDLKSHRKTNRPTKKTEPTNIVIPDEITDPIKRDLYYKQQYHLLHYSKNREYYNSDERKKQRKESKKRRAIKRRTERLLLNQEKVKVFCDKFNLSLEFYNQQNPTSREHTITLESIILNKIRCKNCGVIAIENKLLGKKHLCETCYSIKTLIKEKPLPKKNDNVIQKIKEIHIALNKNFDYSLVNYKSYKKPIIIICPEHGKFERTPEQLLRFVHCQNCKSTYMAKTTEGRIKESIEKFEDSFDYSKFNYIRKDDKCIFICKKNEHEYEQTLRNHITGKIGCKYCLNRGDFHSFASKNGLSKRKNLDKELTRFKTNMCIRILEKLKYYFAKPTPSNNPTLSKYEILLGCSFKEGKKYIEDKWEPWMNWDNHGIYIVGEYNVGWDVDHIIPTSSAKSKEELIKLFHYTNLQPLCSNINRNVKRDKITY